MRTNRFIAVWGGGGTGKTVLSIKIAKELSEQKKNVLVVHCDDETPTLPLVIPATDDIKSLGELLSKSSITQNIILQHCVPFGGNGYISLIGYKLGDYGLKYSEYSLQRAKEFLMNCCKLDDIDYVIADCSHHTMENILTVAALQTADKVIKVCNANIKSMVYVDSQKQLLQGEQFHYSQQINVLNNVLPSQDTYPFREALKGAPYVFPHCPALASQCEEQKLFENLSGREARKYKPMLKQLVKEVLLDEQE